MLFLSIFVLLTFRRKSNKLAWCNVCDNVGLPYLARLDFLKAMAKCFVGLDFIMHVHNLVCVFPLVSDNAHSMEEQTRIIGGSRGIGKHGTTPRRCPNIDQSRATSSKHEALTQCWADVGPAS